MLRAAPARAGRRGPDEDGGGYLFRSINVARSRLIQELRDDMKALPVVLSLLDQLYDMRRRMRELSEALRQDLRQTLVEHLARRAS